MEGLQEGPKHSIETPYGLPSDRIVEGTLGGVRLLFLPRHGVGHRIAPHQVNYRANIHALKQLGAGQILSVSAVGSLKEDLRPGDVVFVDQFIDRTQGRNATFFERIPSENSPSGAEGTLDPWEAQGCAVAHASLADPVDPGLRIAAQDAAQRLGLRHHRGGTYVCIQGPQFSTRAESHLYRSWGADVIGMTNLTEAKLAREAQLPYASACWVTDYDCWREGEEAVTVEAVLSTMRANGKQARAWIAEVIKALPDPATSPASTAMKHAVVTDLTRVPDTVRKRLALLLDSL